MRPIDLGGLGIHNLEVMGWALQMRWLWLEKTGAARPWAGLEIPVYPNAVAMFVVATKSLVGNGRTTCFWTDRWLHGSRLEDLAPNVVKCVSLRIRKRRLVFEALQGNTWVTDIQGALGWRGLAEYLELWDMLANVNLNDTEDIHRWKLEASGFFHQDQPIRTSSSLPSPLNHGRKCGRPGPLENVKHLCGWLLGIDVGLLTACKKKRPPIPRSLPSL